MMAVVSILAAGFLLTSLASYFVSRKSLKAEITDRSLPLTSDNIYSEIERDLLAPVFISSLMAHDTFVRDWVLEGELNEAEITHYLSEIKRRYNTVTCFFVSEKTGNYYYAGGILKKVSPDESRDVWYYRVKNMTDDYEINIDPDLANKDTMTIFINYRVYDYEGHFIGATGVGLAVNLVKQLIGDYQEKYGRNIFFIDRKGNITLRGAAILNDQTSIHNVEGLRDYEAEILETPGKTYMYTRDHARYYLNTRYIKEFDWILLVEENETTSSLILVRTLIINMLFSLLITLVIFALIRVRIRSYQKKIELLASTDKLTGLHNRQAFDLLIAQAIKEKKCTPVDLSMLMVDLDHFKNINDNWGHLVGDSILTQAAGRLKDNLRDVDSVCRWGGEEFLLLLRDCTVEDAVQMAEKLRTAFEKTAFPVGDITIPLTISIGVTGIGTDETYETALARADVALYCAKTGGRNRVASNPCDDIQRT